MSVTHTTTSEVIISFLASPFSLKISVATENNKRKFMHLKQLMPIKRSQSIKGIAKERMHPFEAFGNSQTDLLRISPKGS